MSVEVMKDGRMALRVEVRTGKDGWTRAAVQIGPEPDSGWLVLASAHSDAYNASEEVRAAFFQLAKAVIAQIVTEATGAGIEGAHCVPPGSPLDLPKH